MKYILKTDEKILTSEISYWQSNIEAYTMNSTF